MTKARRSNWTPTVHWTCSNGSHTPHCRVGAGICARPFGMDNARTRGGDKAPRARTAFSGRPVGEVRVREARRQRCSAGRDCLMPIDASLSCARRLPRCQRSKLRSRAIHRGAAPATEAILTHAGCTSLPARHCRGGARREAAACRSAGTALLAPVQALLRAV